MGVFERHEGVFKMLAEGVSEGMIVVNQEGYIVATNTYVEEMFGYEEGELKGQPLNVMIPKEYHRDHVKHFDSFVEEGGKRAMGKGRDLFGIRKDNSRFPVEAGLNPFLIEGRTYVMALIMDITVRKLQEQKIIDLNVQLEEKIEERTHELRKTIKELEEEVRLRKEAEARMKESLKKERDLNDLKTKFLSLVSHEFKTPLSGISTSATLIQKYTKTEHQEKRDKHLTTIRSKVKYLDNILNDFLSVERLETGKVNYKFSTFPLSKVINEVVYDANMLLKDGQRINYPMDIDDYVLDFDEKILELILSNLINNAVKYSREHTTIDLQVSLEDNVLTFKIVDQGIGIPQKEQQFIFNRYFRAENALLDQGTGIGLNIVKSHLENLGGAISFLSEENVGTTFIVKIPVVNNHDQ
ncbi:PAS domain-containing sensor histidine kinase [Aquimarina algicola]|uniref:histidine kinase n=1 Tax=Aquimarina algicola TaxID=2589995 RepID=A0A504JM01_9FLAO|nr:PAS domain-containing sensor histidine kinase [Aquimarina algicola]TPN87490.1 PAS domain S-box protein [Aquimarina algicola]